MGVELCWCVSIAYIFYFYKIHVSELLSAMTCQRSAILPAFLYTLLYSSLTLLMLYRTCSSPELYVNRIVSCEEIPVIHVHGRTQMNAISCCLSSSTHARKDQVHVAVMLYAQKALIYKMLLLEYLIFSRAALVSP